MGKYNFPANGCAPAFSGALTSMGGHLRRPATHGASLREWPVILVTDPGYRSWLLILTMHDTRSSLRTLLCAFLAFALVGGLAACKTASTEGSRAAPTMQPIGARLAPIGGSVARGSVSFRSYEGGVIMVANFGGVSAGVHRIAIHMNANCTSPNGFSAGAPMLLPGSSAPVVVFVRTEGSEGTVATVTRIAGLAIDGVGGVDGKSIVVHEGAEGSLEARPGVPNGRVACGLIGPVPALF